MEKTVSVMPVVDNRGPIRISIREDVSCSTPLSDLIKGEVITFEGQKIINLKILLQKNSYGDLKLSNPDIEKLWKNKIDDLSEAKAKNQFLFLENQIDQDGDLIKFDPVFFCREKNIFFSPVCPRCGSGFEICRDEEVLTNLNKESYKKSYKRYLSCKKCALKKGGAELYGIEDAGKLILRMKSLFSEYVEQWTTVPETEESIKKFLKDFVNGIGDHLANLIVGKFGKDTIKILRENPDKLSEFRGMGNLRLRNIKKSLKDAFKRKVRIGGKSIKRIKEELPCYSCKGQKNCFRSEETSLKAVYPVAFFPFSMIVYKDDMTKGDIYLENLKEQNSMNSLLRKCSFLTSVYASLRDCKVHNTDPSEYLRRLEVKRTKGKPFVFYPAVFEKSKNHVDLKFFVSIWFSVFLFNESNQKKLRSLIALINEYSQERESIVRRHMVELGTPENIKNGSNIWKYIVNTGLDFLNLKIPTEKDFTSALEIIQRKLNDMIADIEDHSFKDSEEDKLENEDIHGMKMSFLKIEEVYIKSLEAIIRDIVKEFNPDNGYNGNGVSGFLKMLRKRDEFGEKFRKFKDWYESGLYIERFMGEVQRNFDSIEE